MIVKEKFKINTDTLSKVTKLDDRVDWNSTIFTEEEAEEIKKSCYDLPIFPDFLLQRKNIKQFIDICYETNLNNHKDLIFPLNVIRIKKDTLDPDYDRYAFKIILCDQYDPFAYPLPPKEAYYSLEDVFKDVHKYWRMNKVQSTIKKYKK